MRGPTFLRKRSWWCLGLTLILVSSGCIKAPVPAEADQVEKIDRELAGAGASFLLIDDTCRFQSALLLAQADMEKERARMWPFRDMDRVRLEFLALSREGDDLLQRARDLRDGRMKAAAASLAGWREKIADLRRLTTLMNEGRFARSHLIQAELLLDEAGSSLKRGDYQRTELLLTQVAMHGRRSDSTLEPILSRYSDRSQIARWRDWVQDTLDECRRSGGVSLIVYKLDRKMVAYRDGRPIRTFPVGLGANGLSHKRQSGDDATPEGRYHIARKNPNSRYYKALLIDYPNDEDRRQFALAKRRGQISARSGIGSLVEIHGGGNDSMTYGCISLDNQLLDQLYDMVQVGTPVTIVGTIEGNNSLAECRNGKSGG
jgi:hypothetical protein